MSGQPHDYFQERLESLERSNRFWKTIALAAGALLLVLFLIGAGGSTILVMRAQAARMEAMRAQAEAQVQRDQSEAALQQARDVMKAEQAARHEAEAARQKLDVERKKLEEAGEKARKAEKEAKDQAQRALYAAQILLAQQARQAPERKGATPPKGP